MIVENWVTEQCSTEGAGDLILTGAPANRTRFQGAFSAGDTVYYAIEDGNDREAGTGIFNGIDRIARTPDSVLKGGVYSNNLPTELLLSGSSIVRCTVNAEAYKELLSNPGLQSHIDNTDNPHQTTKFHVGLGSVPNIDTTVAALHAEIIDGNPHNTNAAQVSFSTTTDLVSTNVGSAIEEVKALTDNNPESLDVPNASFLSGGGAVTKTGEASLNISAGTGVVVSPYNRLKFSILSYPSEWSNYSVDVSEYMTDPYLGHFNVGYANSETDYEPEGFVFRKMTPEDSRSVIKLATVFYDQGVITGIIQETMYQYFPVSMIMDLMGFMNLNVLRRGLKVSNASNNARQFYVNNGALFIPGANFLTNPLRPNQVTISQQGGADLPVTFRKLHIVNNAIVTLGLFNTIPEEYSPNGVVTPIPPGESSIHYLFMDKTGAFFLQLGQFIYANKDASISALVADRALTEFVSYLTSNYYLIARLVVQEGVGGYFTDGNNEIINEH